MNKKLTTLVGIFFAGLVAGSLLVMRWIRMENGVPETATPLPDAGPASEEDQGEDAHGLHRFTEPIKTGAKADIIRVRRVCTRVVRRTAHQPEQVDEELVPADIA